MGVDRKLGTDDKPTEEVTGEGRFQSVEEDKSWLLAYHIEKKITYYGIGGDEYESIGSIIDIPGALDTKK